MCLCRECEHVVMHFRPPVPIVLMQRGQGLLGHKQKLVNYFQAVMATLLAKAVENVSYRNTCTFK